MESKEYHIPARTLRQHLPFGVVDNRIGRPVILTICRSCYRTLWENL